MILLQLPTNTVLEILCESHIQIIHPHLTAQALTPSMSIIAKLQWKNYKIRNTKQSSIQNGRMTWSDIDKHQSESKSRTSRGGGERIYDDIYGSWHGDIRIRRVDRIRSATNQSPTRVNDDQVNLTHDNSSIVIDAHTVILMYCNISKKFCYS